MITARKENLIRQRKADRQRQREWLFSADQKPSNRLRHTPADTYGELVRTTASAGSTDTASLRFGTLLDACMHA